MAVSEMRKVIIVGHHQVKNRVVDCLHKIGLVEITEVEDLRLPSVEVGQGVDTACYISKLERIIEILKPYAVKPSALARLLKPKLVVTREQLEQILRKIDIDALFERCTELEDKIKRLKGDIDKKQRLIDELLPWCAIDIGLARVGSTAKTCIRLGIVKAKRFAQLRAMLEQALGRYHYHIEDVATRDKTTYFVIVCLKKHEGKLEEVCKSSNLQLKVFPEVSAPPLGAIGELREEIVRNELELGRVESELERLAKEIGELYAIYDYYVVAAHRKSVEGKFAFTKSTFVIEGWVRKEDESSLKRELATVSKELHVIARAPREGEDVPVALDNKPLIKPFEFVTTLYGRPAYREVDPTPFLTPFFVFFFALCLTDAGYGLTLAIIALFGIRFVHQEGAARLFRIMLYGGAATALVGVLTGGYFGIDVLQLPAVLQSAIVIDPLREPMKMLSLSFALGVLHISFGLMIKMYRNLKRGDLVSAIFDQGVWLVFIAALAPLAWQAMLGGSVSPWLIVSCRYLSLSCAALVVLTAGRRQKNIVLRFLMGTVKLYDIVGYFGDVLSYARLLALGLATSAIAATVNSIARMVLDTPFYLGYVAALAIVVAGHLFNIAVSTLGGFVHSGRLQYLEFFSKFFEGGGREFKPFRETRKYTVVRR